MSCCCCCCVQSGNLYRAPFSSWEDPEAASGLHVTFSHEVQPVRAAGHTGEPQREQSVEMVRAAILCDTKRQQVEQMLLTWGELISHSVLIFCPVNKHVFIWLWCVLLYQMEMYFLRARWKLQHQCFVFFFVVFVFCVLSHSPCWKSSALRCAQSRWSDERGRWGCAGFEVVVNRWELRTQHHFKC